MYLHLCSWELTSLGVFSEVESLDNRVFRCLIFMDIRTTRELEDCQSSGSTVGGLGAHRTHENTALEAR